MISCNVVSPQVFWSKKIRRSPPPSSPSALLVTIGMWFERFVIIVTSLHRAFLLPFVTLGGATTGFLIALSLQVYSQAIETPFLSGWPIIIGGKPFLSMPAFIPGAF
jgi:hypothetical protein